MSIRKTTSTMNPTYGIEFLRTFEIQTPNYEIPTLTYIFYLQCDLIPPMYNLKVTHVYQLTVLWFYVYLNSNSYKKLSQIRLRIKSIFRCFIYCITICNRCLKNT